MDRVLPLTYGRPLGPLPPQGGTRACPRGRPWLPTPDGPRDRPMRSRTVHRDGEDFPDPEAPKPLDMAALPEAIEAPWDDQDDDSEGLDGGGPAEPATSPVLRGGEHIKLPERWLA
ncbi:hypothetical protein ACIRP2_05705 [Streptomyces sp. NPDC101194]|uniref:hypothetical protein n=1 Tax=Streptomyces sp. NPDC101194 TaxID=3366127 RepID=UPI00380CD66D